MDQALFTEDMIIRKDGALGRITLNSPKALNALNLNMIRDITFALHRWADDPDILAVYIDGAGDRAFCAGGDIKSFYQAGMDVRRGNLALDVAMVFFREEYALNGLIHHYKKPLIVFMDGITMGGGYGIAGHCRFRIATDKTAFAMPEAKIGFFTDVGSMAHLTKAPSHIGHYLALSGESIGGADMLRYGFADFYMKGQLSEHIYSMLAKSISRGQSLDEASQSIKKALQGLSEHEIEQSPLSQHESQIQDIFSLKSLNELLETLQIQSGLLNQISQVIQANSPLSVSVIDKYYKKVIGESLTFDEIIDIDMVLVQRFAEGRDFYEGIRAAVIDKDRAPRWENENLADVSCNIVEDFFITKANA
jgi:enoyl-CoA hydratase